MRRHRVFVWGALLALLGVLAVDAVAGDPLAEVRRRLRAEAGLGEAGGRDELPMVSLTVLPGDTHRRLALDLTGGLDAERVLRKIAPRLRPGDRVYLPRALLSPPLADPRLEPLSLGPSVPTLWRLVRTRVDARGMGTGAVVRCLQRLNGITDPTRLPRGARILVPRSLLGAFDPPTAPLRISRRYRVSDVKGLERRARPEDFPSGLRRKLRKRGLWERQLGPRKVDLTVIHSTEHRGAPFGNVARYIHRKRLTNYLIGPDGTVYEIVPEGYRAFGCGQSLWEGHYAVDFNAINVEVYADTAPGSPGPGIRDAQYEALRALIAELRTRYPHLHDGRVVTHRMVAVSYTTDMRSRKGDPYVFDWARAGLPDNSRAIDQDVLLGRARLCTDDRYVDRVTEGQTAAARFQEAL